MAVIGIGTTSRVSVADVSAVIHCAKTRVAADWHLSKLAALHRPAINPIIEEAASLLSLQSMFLGLEELEAVAHLCITRSEKSLRTYGIPSIAEAAALAAAGSGSRLLLPRFCGRNTTASVAA